MLYLAETLPVFLLPCINLVVFSVTYRKPYYFKIALPIQNLIILKRSKTPFKAILGRFKSSLYLGITLL